MKEINIDWKNIDVIESCLLCEYNQKEHSRCEHCDSENNNFRLSDDGKKLYKKIFEQGYQSRHK